MLESKLLSTCQKCGKKFEVNSLITYPIYCPLCLYNKKAEEFNKRCEYGR